MIKQTALALSLALAGCAQPQPQPIAEAPLPEPAVQAVQPTPYAQPAPFAQPIVLANGGPGYAIACDDAAVGCLARAADTCPGGYFVTSATYLPEPFSPSPHSMEIYCSKPWFALF
jgi:hypothetical protein